MAAMSGSSTTRKPTRAAITTTRVITSRPARMPSLTSCRTSTITLLASVALLRVSMNAYGWAR